MKILIEGSQHLARVTLYYNREIISRYKPCVEFKLLAIWVFCV